MSEEKKMQLAYFGKKNPKTLSLTLDGETRTFGFVPFKATEVPEKFGLYILQCAGDIFKRVDIDERAPDPVGKPIEHLGDPQTEAEKRAEEGKDIEQIVEEEERRARNRRAKRKAEGK